METRLVGPPNYPTNASWGVLLLRGWKYASDSHRPAYAENPHQLCFFASSISIFPPRASPLTARHVLLVQIRGGLYELQVENCHIISKKTSTRNEPENDFDGAPIAQLPLSPPARGRHKVPLFNSSRMVG